MTYKIDVRGVKEVTDFLKSVPLGTIRAALSAAAEYLVGNDRRGLKHQPPRVQHGPGNPYKWQSEKQRRAYFATNGFGGGIPYKRTGKSKQWTVKAQNGGYQAQITSGAPYEQFLRGQNQQRGHAADGWRKIEAIITTNLRGMTRAANQAVARWLKAKKK
jgi:hypothetical protein